MSEIKFAAVRELIKEESYPAALTLMKSIPWGKEKDQLYEEIKIQLQASSYLSKLSDENLLEFLSEQHISNIVLRELAGRVFEYLDVFRLQEEKLKAICIKILKLSNTKSRDEVDANSNYGMLLRLILNELARDNEWNCDHIRTLATLALRKDEQGSDFATDMLQSLHTPQARILLLYAGSDIKIQYTSNKNKGLNHGDIVGVVDVIRDDNLLYSLPLKRDGNGNSAYIKAECIQDALDSRDYGYTVPVALALAVQTANDLNRAAHYAEENKRNSEDAWFTYLTDIAHWESD